MSDSDISHHQLEEKTLEELERDVKLELPLRRSRLWYIVFQHNLKNRIREKQEQSDKMDDITRPTTAASTNSQRLRKIGQSFAVLKSVLTSTYSMNNVLD